MNKKLLHIIAVFFITLLVSACDNSEECKRGCDENGKHCRVDCGSGDFSCIEADDWGDPKIWVPAGTDANEDYTTLQVKGDYDNGQVAAPIDSGQILLDSDVFPLVISAGKRNQWTSWFGGELINPINDNGKKDPYGWDAARVVPNAECTYTVTNGASPGDIRDDLSPSLVWEDPYNIIRNDEFKIVKQDSFYRGVDNKYYKSPYDDKKKIYVATKEPHAGEPLFTNGKTPCYFRYGMGLYVGLAPDDGVGETSGDDVIFTYHIPDAKKPDVVADQTIYFDQKTLTTKPIPQRPDEKSSDAEKQAYADYSASISSSSTTTFTANKEKRGMDGYLVRGFAQQELPGAKPGDHLFFKILDSYYDDNEGGYLVRIREGTRSAALGPIETVTGVLLDPVRIVMKRLYNGLVNNIGFVQMVRAALVLYIVFYGFKWLMGVGSAQELRKDAVIRMFKIGIIVQLISPGSWAFFYDHLFAAFVDGVMEVASLLMSPFADYDPHAPWYSMDRLLAKFFSGETAAKIFSTLFSNIWGLLIVPALYLAIILFVRALLKAVIIWIVGFIAIAILIVMTPIFIIFILFTHTKEVFEEWWKQIMAFAIQEIVLLASLGMLSAIIVWFMQRTIGYTVCWSVWADFDFIGINETGPGWANVHLFNLRFWMPDIGKDMTNIWMDANNDGVRAMNEFAYRYVDLPYFDPVYDKAIIAKYMNGRDFLDIGPILIFIAAVYLMDMFMESIPKMSTSLQGGVGALDSASMFGGGANTGGRGLYNSTIGSAKQMLIGGNFSLGVGKGNKFRSGGLLGVAAGALKLGKFGYSIGNESNAYSKAKRALLDSTGVGGGATRMGAGASQDGKDTQNFGGGRSGLGKPSIGGHRPSLGEGAEEESRTQNSHMSSFKEGYTGESHLEGVESRVNLGAGVGQHGVKQTFEKAAKSAQELRGLTTPGGAANPSSSIGKRSGISTDKLDKTASGSAAESESSTSGIKISKADLDKISKTEKSKEDRKDTKQDDDDLAEQEALKRLAMAGREKDAANSQAALDQKNAADSARQQQELAEQQRLAEQKIALEKKKKEEEEEIERRLLESKALAEQNKKVDEARNSGAKDSGADLMQNPSNDPVKQRNTDSKKFDTPIDQSSGSFGVSDAKGLSDQDRYKDKMNDLKDYNQTKKDVDTFKKEGGESKPRSDSTNKPDGE